MGSGNFSGIAMGLSFINMVVLNSELDMAANWLSPKVSFVFLALWDSMKR